MTEFFFLTTKRKKKTKSYPRMTPVVGSVVVDRKLRRSLLKRRGNKRSVKALLNYDLLNTFGGVVMSRRPTLSSERRLILLLRR